MLIRLTTFSTVVISTFTLESFGYAGFLSAFEATFFVLLLQALFFAHGGLTTLGVNTLTLGVLGPIVTIGL